MFSTNFMKRCLGGVLLLTSIVAGTFLFAFSTANTTGALTTTAVALQSNNIVGTKAAYDIIFKTVSSGSIKTVLILFMKDTDVTGSIIPEVKGLGPGSTSPGPQAGVFRFLIYTVNTPVTISAGREIKLQVWNITNPSVSYDRYMILIYTIDANGNTIDQAMSNAYPMKQIQSADIENNAIVSGKIGIDAVTAKEISGVRKLIFSSCHIVPQGLDSATCSVPGASMGDNVIATSDQYFFSGSAFNKCLAISYATVSGPNVVKIGFHFVPYPPTNICHNLLAVGPSTLSVIVFRP